VNCDPLTDGVDTPSTVDASCGVWVSSSKGKHDSAADGSALHPYDTITFALSQLKPHHKWVYACIDGFAETVDLSQGITLRGGLDCRNSWVLTTTKTPLTAPENTIPLTVSGPSTVVDFAITAVNATIPGGSSIAVVVDSAMATFTGCVLTAGDAVDGRPGDSGEIPATGPDPGKSGNKPTDSTPNGGSGGTNICSSNLNGGNGGDGGAPSGPGQDGKQGDGTMGGAKGLGQDTAVGKLCSEGASGNSGSFIGVNGMGASNIGSIDGSGYHGVDGQPGMDGVDGKSGGGGGGSKGSATLHGAGGGGGGAGGCGGKAGGKGTAGGSSIALVSVSATVILTTCTLTSGKGANGGTGGGGQFGQAGGKAGDGGAASMGVGSACNGGKGGDGGTGGDGGGGLGGHSLGIAATGSAPKFDGATITLSSHGSGGLGGNMDASMNHGADGMAAACWDFMSNAACN
jgi:hypothetical protein